MFVLNSDIRIGEYALQGVHEVVIKRSVNELADTAVVKVPVSAMLHDAGKAETRIEVARHIRMGDPVRIRLGYDLRMHEEFVGYVKTLNLKSPLEIVCEDAFYPIRSRKVSLSGTKTLQQILEKCGLRIAAVETLTLRNFVAKDKSVAGILAEIKTQYGLSVYFDTAARVYAVRPGRVGAQGRPVEYGIGQNVISTDDLRYQNAEDIHLSIRAVAFKKDGTRVEATKGIKGYPAQTLYFYNITSLTELSTLADIELRRLAFDGYRGTLTGFLEPYAAPGMAAAIYDEKYRSRGGRYFIESVETTFGQQGARRKVELGRKIEKEDE